MESKILWYSAFVAVNALLLLILAANVSRLRIKHKISYGDNGNRDLLRAMRAHANGAEQVPIFSLMLLALCLTNGNQLLISVLAVTFTLSRIFHACGILYRVFMARRIGAGASYLLQAIAAVALLAQSLA